MSSSATAHLPPSRRAFGGAVGAGAAAAAGLSAAEARAATPGSAPGTAPETQFRAAAGQHSRRPNILVVLGDDLGWADLSCYGAPHLHTPHLDRLAGQGVRFTNAYASSAMCSPTRFALYTGRYPGRTEGGLAEPITDHSVGLEPSHPTLASLLRDAGYATAMIGKWHCGHLPDHSPTKSGWEEFFGSLGGGLEYYSKLGLDGEYDLYEGDVLYQDLRYYTRILTERAVEFTRREHARPWLLNLNYTTPHCPWIAEGDTEVAARVEQRVRAGDPRALWHDDGGSVEKYAEMVEDLDRSVGRVLAAIGASGQERDTLVLFTSDNGGERYSYRWPLSGQKTSLREGGIRVPTILRWPARLYGGQVSDEPVCTTDWTATLLDVAGARPHPGYPLDGASLAGYLLRGEPLPERDLFWRLRNERALRRGNWKYYRGNGTPDQLFDLATDRREQADQAAVRPRLLAQLAEAWDRVDAGLLPYPA